MADEVQGGGGDDLQFAAVESATPGQPAGAPQCVACKRPIVDQYFTAGDKVVCPDCRSRYEATLQEGSKFGRFMKATLLGIGAGLISAGVWFGIRHYSEYDFVLIAIVVGLFVGGAVRKGSAGRGGLGYQFLAVLVTYFAMGLSVVPEAFFPRHEKPVAAQSASNVVGDARSSAATQQAATADDATDDDDAPAPHRKIVVTLIMVVYLLFASPVYMAIKGFPIGTLIVGFALWEAWKINASRRLSLDGPYSLAGRPPNLPQPLPPVMPGGQG